MAGDDEPSGEASPILIIGTERSGSNLLRLMLNAHPHIAIPHPPHLMRYLAPFEPSYGDLEDRRNRARLARDALAIQRRHIHPWEHAIDLDEVVERSHPSVFGVVAAIYDQYRRAEGKPRWGCKSTFMVDYVEQVLEVFPRARFIWLVRDPRDVAASAKEAVFGHCHPVLSARLWNRQQLRAREACGKYAERTIRLLRYEDLVSAPEIALKEVCQFLDEEFHDVMLEPHLTPAAQQIAALSKSWRNTGTPVNSSRVGSHARRLSPAERRWVEGVTREMADELGYPMPADGNAAPPPGRLSVRAVDTALRLRVEANSARNDRNYWRRKERDAVVQLLAFRARARTLAKRLPSVTRHSPAPRR